MKTILMICHPMDSVGGTSTVGAWALEALKGRGHQVTVLAWRKTDVTKTQAGYGTSFVEQDFRWTEVPAAWRRILAALPWRLALLEMSLLFFWARKLNRETPYDVVVSTIGEIDIGARAIQYVHFPWAYFPRPEVDYRWYHLKILLLSYRAMCRGISGFDRAAAARNEALVNSDWTKRFYEEWYQAPAKVLYPPVPGGFPAIPAADRELAFVTIGRISPEKELGKLIEILDRVRRRGHDLRYRIIGLRVNEAYYKRLVDLARDKGDWISFHANLPRAEMVRMVAHCRFGIHGMVGEHFGIAPAELQRAGCVTFVPHDGGPVEIVGGDERVIYRSIEDAVEKIVRVLSEPDLEQLVRRDVEKRGELFSETRFMAELRSVIEDFQP